MASSGQTNILSRKRIRANAQVRKKGDTPEAPPEEETTVASRADDAQHIVSKPVKAAKKNGRLWGPGSTLIVVLGTVVIGGIAAILGLRHLAEIVGGN